MRLLDTYVLGSATLWLLDVCPNEDFCIVQKDGESCAGYARYEMLR